jgi:hypothetical protein
MIGAVLEAVRRGLDQRRVGWFAGVVAASLLLALLAGAVTVISVLEDQLLVMALFGLVTVSAVRMLVVVLAEGVHLLRRDGRLDVVPAPSGAPATAFRRSRAVLVAPVVTSLLVDVLLACFLVVGLDASWWVPLGCAAVGVAVLGPLTPILTGRTVAGGLFLTADGVEHRLGPHTWSAPWDRVRTVSDGEPVVVLVAGQPDHRTSTRWPWAWEPGDQPRAGTITVPTRFLPAGAEDVATLVATYAAQPHLRAHLGAPASLEWWPAQRAVR